MPRLVSILLQTPALTASVPIRSSVLSSPDWQLWTAATLTDGTLRSTMISRVKGYASSRVKDGPFPDRYNSENGKMVAFENRAVVGGHFALVCHSIPLP